MAVIYGTIQSERLMRKVPFAAILPSEVKKDETVEPFKTLYLLHGWNDASDAWINNTRIVELATKHNIAVIMPSGENSFYVDLRNGSYYGQYIGEELVQITRKMFNLSQDFESTWIAGLSMGGYGALRNGLYYNETFSKIAALSSRVLQSQEKEHDLSEDNRMNQAIKYIIGSDTYKDMDKDKDIYSLVKKESIPELFIACGTEDFIYKDSLSLHNYLSEQKIDHIYKESSGEHSWDFWDHYIEQVIEWMIEI
ncbi:alpha/beta hydrolase [Marinilactibacillus sp. GCM10026970]|uniref:alpha/beta hydrolase n=1 Tax=Marinilactibacillus sp. GCM10026970 TaxID=3252642 RepID=UPI0036180189